MATSPRPIARIDQPEPLRWRMDLRMIGGALLAVIALRIVLGVVALAVSADFPQLAMERQISVIPGDAPLGRWLQRDAVMPWIRYDADWYRRIVDHGYRRDEGTAAFHPLYPLSAALFAVLLGGNSDLALLLVSTLASVALCVLFTRYVAHVHGREYAQPAGWLLLMVPPAFVLLAPYSESTFLVFAVASLFAMSCERWWLAGLLGGLAALTRQQGLALALPLAWGLLDALRQRRIRLWNGAALALVPLGYGLVVVYRAIVLHDISTVAQSHGPFDFLSDVLVSRSAQEVAVGQHITWPWAALIDELGLIFTTPNSYYMVIDLVLGWSGVLIVLLGLREMRVLERLYSLGVVGMALCYYNGYLSPYMAFPRHILIAFPLVIVLARWAGRGLRLWMLLEVGLLVNLFLLGIFVRNGWVP